MKQAIMALDGGGSNLRIIVVDRNTDEVLFSKDINTGTNLSSVPNKEEALNNVKQLVLEGFTSLPEGYCLTGIGLSSAGIEIKENKIKLEEALKETVEIMKKSSNIAQNNPPQYYVTNDIDILLHSADMALVAGTGTVGAVKYKDIKPYDNTDKNPEYTIYKFDGNGQFIGDKGSGYWIAKEVLTKVVEIENLGGFMNSQGEFVEVEPSESILRELVLERIFEEKGIPKEEISNIIKNRQFGEFVALVYDVTQEEGRPFGRAKVGNLFSKIADDAAYYGDEAANDILKQASTELLKNVTAGYIKGDFENKEECTLLLSGSVLVHSKIVRTYLEQEIKAKYPNVHIKLNKEKPVWSTVRYVEGKLSEKEKSKEDDGRE